MYSQQPVVTGYSLGISALYRGMGWRLGHCYNWKKKKLPHVKWQLLREHRQARQRGHTWERQTCSKNIPALILVPDGVSISRSVSPSKPFLKSSFLKIQGDRTSIGPFQQRVLKVVEERPWKNIICPTLWTWRRRVCVCRSIKTLCESILWVPSVSR